MGSADPGDVKLLNQSDRFSWTVQTLVDAAKRNNSISAIAVPTALLLTCWFHIDFPHP